MAGKRSRTSILKIVRRMDAAAPGLADSRSQRSLCGEARVSRLGTSRGAEAPLLHRISYGASGAEARPALLTLASALDRHLGARRTGVGRALSGARSGKPR